MPAMIVLGDKTDHGGEVIEASGVTDTHGKRIARVGDKVACPKKGHSNAVIVTGDPTMVIDGQPVAYHGCKTSCGATLISSQAVSTVSFGGGAAGTSASQGIPAAALSGAAQESALVGIYDEQAHLVASAGTAWFIKTNEGKTLSGMLGEDGLLPRLDTLQEGEYEVYWGDEAIAMRLDSE
jgi:uncharacterized Zn-binding protein involved in type VI secretion